ncbi:MAG: hypothetical protein H0W33_08755 [Gammaproteobacteria bacterium]|nr:hypothetical protein [Gammaproteobacteria bacterium]
MQSFCKAALIALFLLDGASSASVADECAHSAESLDELVDRHTAARGGRAAIEAVRSIRYDLHLQEPEFEVDLIVQLARPNYMRVDVYTEEDNVYTEAFDGERAWQRNGPEAVAEWSGDEPTAALRHATQFPTHLYGLHELEDHGHELKLKRTPGDRRPLL